MESFKLLSPCLSVKVNHATLNKLYELRVSEKERLDFDRECAAFKDIECRSYFLYLERDRTTKRSRFIGLILDRSVPWSKHHLCCDYLTVSSVPLAFINLVPLSDNWFQQIIASVIRAAEIKLGVIQVD